MKNLWTNLIVDFSREKKKKKKINYFCLGDKVEVNNNKIFQLTLLDTFWALILWNKENIALGAKQLMALTDKIYPDKSNLENHLRMLIYYPNFKRMGLGNYCIK